MDNTNVRGRERSNNLAGQTLQPPISQNPNRTPSNLNILTNTIENSMIRVSPVATEQGSRQSSKEPQLNVYYADPNKTQPDNKKFIKGEFKYTTKGDQAAQHRGFEGRSNPRGFKCQTTAQHGLPHVLRQTSTIGKFTKLRNEQEMMRHSFENEKQIDDEAGPSAPLKENNNLANGRRGRTGLTNQEFTKGSYQYTTKGGYAAYHRGFEGRCNPRGFRCNVTAQHSTLNIIRQEAPIGQFVKMTDEQQMMRHSFEEHHQQDFDPPKIETNPYQLMQNNNLLNAQPRIPEPWIEQKPIKIEPPQIKNTQNIPNNQVLPPPVRQIIQNPEPVVMIPKKPEKESSIYTFEAGLAANNQKMIQNIVDLQSNQIKENLSNIPLAKPINNNFPINEPPKILPNNSNMSNKPTNLPPINPPMVEPKFYENYDEEDDLPIPNRKGRNQTVLQNAVIIPQPSKPKQQEIESPDTSLILTEFKKELMKVEPTLASTEHQDSSVFRNSNHISQILGGAPNKNQPLFSSFSTVAPRDKAFKGIMNMEIERLNSDDSDAANDPTILEFRDALDQAIETSKMYHRKERSTVNPRSNHTKPQEAKRNMTPHTRTQTHTRDTSMASMGNFLGRGPDSNSTSFILPSGNQQYQDQRVNQTMMYDAADSYDGEWDLNKKYNEAMQAKWKTQRGLQGQGGGGALNQIKAVDSRPNKGNRRDILDYLK